MAAINGKSLGPRITPTIVKSSAESVTGIPTDEAPASDGRLFSSVGGDPEFSLTPVYNAFRRVFSHQMTFPDGVEPLLFAPNYSNNDLGITAHSAVGYVLDGEFVAWRFRLTSHFHAEEQPALTVTCPDGRINKILSITNRANAGIGVLYEGGATPSSRGVYLARVDLPEGNDAGEILSTVKLWDESTPSPEGSQVFLSHVVDLGSTFPSRIFVVRQRPDLEWDIVHYDLDATATTYPTLHGLGTVNAVEAHAIAMRSFDGDNRFNHMHIIMDVESSSPDVLEVRIDQGTPPVLSIKSTVPIPQLSGVIGATEFVYSRYGISLAVQTASALNFPYQATAGVFSWAEVPTETASPLVALTPSSEGQTWLSTTAFPAHMAIFRDGSVASVAFRYGVGYTEPFRLNEADEVSVMPYATHHKTSMLLARYGSEWVFEAYIIGSIEPRSGPMIGFHEYHSNAWLWDPTDNLSFIGTGPYEPSLVNADFSTCATPHRGKIWSFYGAFSWSAQSVQDGEIVMADPLDHANGNDSLFLYDALLYSYPGYPDSVSENDLLTDIDYVTCTYNDSDGIIIGTFNWELAHWNGSVWDSQYGTFLKLTESSERGVTFTHLYSPVPSLDEVHQDFYNNGVAFLGKSNGAFYAASGFGNSLTGDIWKLDADLSPISSIHLDPPHASEWEFAQMGIEPNSGDFFLLTWYGLHRYTPTGTLLKSMYFVDLDAGESGVFDDEESYYMDFDDDSPMNMIFHDKYVYVKFSYSEATHKGSAPNDPSVWTNSGPGVLRIDIEADPWIKTFGPDGTVHWRANNVIYGGSGGGLFLYENVQPFVSSTQAVRQRTIFV